MTARQSQSKHASIYMLNGFYFCPKLARNYDTMPLEFLKTVIDIIFESVKIILNIHVHVHKLMLNYS